MTSINNAFALSATILFFIGGSAIASDMDSPAIKLKHSAEHISAQKISPRIICEKASPDFLVALDGAMTDNHIAITKEGGLWQKEIFPIFSYSTDLPLNEKDKAYALRVLELARRENFVAAKIANDEGARRSKSYLDSSFFKNMHQLISSSTTPEIKDNNEKKNEFDIWMNEVQIKIKNGQDKLGILYKDLPVRFFVSGNAMDDGLAVDASQRVLCAKEKDENFLGTIAKIGYQSRTKKPR